ncbi:hypothetical protein HPT25_23390 [Bacillus sp. BRMEA1]|uniref:hypothetical protein n=1 Tax=Neobacillus endophyticus TaxID=2738405 RepID=UPI001C27EB36|nr:hypothetical protein [Neobacillus endophyticus]NRD80270.1 hypothetical protein [Neobacillus endophyticus]
MLSITYYDNIKYHRMDFINRDKDFFGNGVVSLTHFPYTLPAPNNMTISIGAGAAWVDGYRIENDSTGITLTVPASDATNPRIDIVQVGHDDINSQAVLSIKKGVAASSPIEPDADPNFVKLFAINVPATATAISASNITDRRALVPLKVSGSQISFQGAYQKPLNGIPKTDMESSVQTSLGKADNSVQISDYVAHPGFGTTTNSGNAYSVTLTPAPTAYAGGMTVRVQLNADSTGSATLNVNSLGAIPLKSANGNDATSLKANGIYTFTYNASTGNFILQGEGVDVVALSSSINAIYDK